MQTPAIERPRPRQMGSWDGRSSNVLLTPLPPYQILFRKKSFIFDKKPVTFLNNIPINLSCISTEMPLMKSLKYLIDGNNGVVSLTDCSTGIIRLRVVVSLTD